MKKLIPLGLLTACGLYFGPDYGQWTLTDVRVVSIECVEEGFDDLPFALGTSLDIEKSGYPLKFELAYDALLWRGGPLDTVCTLDDKVFLCEYGENEWRSSPTGTVPTELGQCAETLTESDSDASCWSQIMEVSGEFYGEDNRFLSTTYLYTLACLTGADCLLTPGESRCTATIEADYSF